MRWSIQQVARISGVTARTLRYYDEIGLLRPAHVGTNGYRYYEREQLLRLQQILLLRELGLDLTTIASVVDAQNDPIEALRRHHRRLLDERGRLDRLVATVAATITHLEEGTDMAEDELFEGFELSPDYVRDLEAQRIQNTGDTEQPELAQVKQNTADWTDQDYSQFNADGAELTRRLLDLLRQGIPADADKVFAVLDDDLAMQRKLWEPDKTSYIALANSLAEPSELRSFYDAQDPRLSGYLRTAMLAYAEQRMP
ncbi:MerR family transcriptional regulator [Gordonia sp. OPL2]|uniref:MerR family transcriptional regulator n=1 Tax=Gordonia sp. OPL2 TaxID=2486274 RepID=UPI00165643E6|nr:MerR family transcriptional regulator [Gordonia sp. OPL2]ROZ88002.1 MerR family transcriptional regulator [Gordonia sp. OPL2]